MHEFAQNCVCNARKLLAAGALPQTDPAGGAYDAPPNLLVGWGVDKPPAHTSPHQSLRRLASSSSATQVQMCPSQNNFLDPPLAERGSNRWTRGLATSEIRLPS